MWQWNQACSLREGFVHQPSMLQLQWLHLLEWPLEVHRKVWANDLVWPQLLVTCDMFKPSNSKHMTNFFFFFGYHPMHLGEFVTRNILEKAWCLAILLDKISCSNLFTLWPKVCARDPLIVSNPEEIKYLQCSYRSPISPKNRLD